mgnify:CR=1 FL=1
MIHNGYDNELLDRLVQIGASLKLDGRHEDVETIIKAMTEIQRLKRIEDDRNRAWRIA